MFIYILYIVYVYLCVSVCAHFSYCVEFKLTSLTAGCQHSVSPHTRWMRYLKEGHEVCVECQPPALAQGQRYCSGDGENMGQDR